MLTIRDEQLATLGAPLRARVREQVLAVLREALPARLAGVADDELGARVDAAIALAPALGIDSVADLGRFLVVCVVREDFGAPGRPPAFLASPYAGSGATPRERVLELYAGIIHPGG